MSVVACCYSDRGFPGRPGVRVADRTPVRGPVGRWNTPRGPVGWWKPARGCVRLVANGDNLPISGRFRCRWSA